MFKDFIASCRSDQTREQYEYVIKRVLGKLDPDEFIKLACEDRRNSEDIIMNYILDNQKNLASSTLNNRINILKSFMEYMEISFNWKRIKRPLPKSRSFSNDRPPTVEEIRRLSGICDLRDRTIILIMTSGGFRVGAFNWLNVGDYEKLVSGVGKLRIYRGTDDEYVTFISPEACKSLDEYLSVRKRIGEDLLNSSPLLRNRWNNRLIQKELNKKNKDMNKFVVSRFTSHDVSTHFWRLWILSGVLTKGDRSIKSVHGFRKFFKTRANQVMKDLDVEVLMAHSLGISDSYYKPTLDHLEKEYLKAVPLLTISEVEEVRRESDGKLKIERDKFRELEDRVSRLDLMFEQYRQTETDK